MPYYFEGLGHERAHDDVEAENRDYHSRQIASFVIATAMRITAGQHYTMTNTYQDIRRHGGIFRNDTPASALHQYEEQPTMPSASHRLSIIISRRR